MAWHVLTSLGDAMWRTEAGVALPGGGTATTNVGSSPFTGAGSAGTRLKGTSANTGARIHIRRGGACLSGLGLCDQSSRSTLATSRLESGRRDGPARRNHESG